MPVFNASNLINKSIASILSQSLEDIEIICIDDGSTDNTLDILNGYANQFDFIKVLTQENQGSGKARNYGIREASGDYIGFLDADDFFISNFALEKLYETAVKNDALMVTGNIKLVNDDGGFTPFYPLEYYTEYKKILPEEYGIPWSFYKNIFKREFLIENNIEFPNLIRGQDPVFLAEILSLVDAVYTVPIDVYAYFYVDGFSKVNTDRKYHDHMMHYKMVFDDLSDERFSETRYKFMKEMTRFVKIMGEEHAEKILSVTREIFREDEDILKNFEEYFHIAFKDNPDLTKLVNVEKDINNPRISVIMPSNNFEESIQSVLNQTFDDFELICYNNHQITSSYIKNLSNDNPQIIINDEIRSIPDALKIARGKYVYFFNPKGQLIDTALEGLYENAILNNSDMVLFKLAKLNQDKSIDYEEPLYNLDEIFGEEFDFKNFAFNHKTISGHLSYIVYVPWNKLFRKEFLDENIEIMFGNMDDEDIIFNIELIFKTNHMSYSPEFYYIYRGEEYANNYFNNDIINIINSIEMFLKDNDYFDEYEFEFNKFKVKYLSKNIIPSQSEEYFKQVKDMFSKMDMSIVEVMPYPIMKNHNWVMYSNNLHDYILKDQIDDNSTETFMEFHLKSKIYALENKIKKLESKNKKLVNEKNKLNKDIKSLKDKNKKIEKLNKEILSSKSWKITKPMRKLKNM